MVNVSSFLWTSAGQKADGITPTPPPPHTWRTSTMWSRPLSSVSVGTRGVPGNYTTGWITCRSIDCRSNDCRSNDCRSIDCRINGTTPYFKPMSNQKKTLRGWTKVCTDRRTGRQKEWFLYTSLNVVHGGIIKINNGDSGDQKICS